MLSKRRVIKMRSKRMIKGLLDTNHALQRAVDPGPLSAPLALQMF
jgi:hypothetical protein